MTCFADYFDYIGNALTNNKQFQDNQGSKKENRLIKLNSFRILEILDSHW